MSDNDNDNLLTDDLDSAEVEEGEGEEGVDVEDILPPPNMSEDGEDTDDDADIVADEFSPVEEEFDPEDPDAYLYNKPSVKFTDSADEDESDWLDTGEEF